MTGYGDSAPTIASQASALKLYENYRVSASLPELNSIDRDVFYTDAFFQKLAFYLTDVYRTKSGTSLKMGTALGYIGCLMIIDETTLFKGSHTGVLQIFVSMIFLIRLILLGDPFFLTI